MFAKLCIFAWQKAKPPNGKAGCEHEYQGGKESPDAMRIKLGKTEAPPVQTVKYDIGYQVSGDDEEYIDSRESAPQKFRKGVIDNHGQYGYGSEAIDIWPIYLRTVPFRA